MNRRKFFKRFVIGTAAVIVSPKIIAEVTKPIDSKKLYSQVIILKNRSGGMTYMYNQHPEYAKMPMSQEDFYNMVKYLKGYYDKSFIWPEKI